MIRDFSGRLSMMKRWMRNCETEYVQLSMRCLNLLTMICRMKLSISRKCKLSRVRRMRSGMTLNKRKHCELRQRRNRIHVFHIMNIRKLRMRRRRFLKWRNARNVNGRRRQRNGYVRRYGMSRNREQVRLRRRRSRNCFEGTRRSMRKRYSNNILLHRLKRLNIKYIYRWNRYDIRGTNYTHFHH